MRRFEPVRTQVVVEAALEVCTCDFCGEAASSGPTREGGVGMVLDPKTQKYFVPGWSAPADLAGWVAIAPASAEERGVAGRLMCPSCQKARLS